MSAPRTLRCICAALTGLLAIACSDPPDSQGEIREFVPAEDNGPAVNRILTTDVTESGAAGVEIEIAIQADAVERLFGGHFVLTYDPDAVAIASVRPGDLLAGGHLVTSLGDEDAVPGALAIGFARASAPEDTTAVSGTLCVVAVEISRVGSSEIAFQPPSFWWPTRERALVAADGVVLGGTRWLGGTVRWEAE
jgi:hypothetical protein